MNLFPVPPRARAVLFAALALSTLLQVYFATVPIRKMRKQDCYWIQFECDRLVAGQNPYSRLLLPVMERDHYPTHLPLIYVLGAIPKYFGMVRFAPWLYMLRALNFLASLALAVLLLRVGTGAAGPTWGVAGAVFWLLNFFTLYVQRVAQVDLLIVLLIAVSVLLRTSNRALAWGLLGVSLAVKHFGIFLIPLYLLEEKSVVSAFKGLIWCAFVPLTVSIPFLMWDARGLIASVAFSITRSGNNWFTFVLMNEGFWGRFELLKAFGVVYLFTRLERWSLARSATLLYAFFLILNPVIYQQYVVYGLFFLTLFVLTDARARAWVEKIAAPARSRAAAFGLKFRAVRDTLIRSQRKMP